MGLRIPEDVAVAGFDDILMAAHFPPPLTTVRQPAAAIGRRAAELLLARIAGARRDGDPPVHERVPCEVMIRSSCGAGLPRAGALPEGAQGKGRTKNSRGVKPRASRPGRIPTGA
jgi:hypothetical protein